MKEPHGASVEDNAVEGESERSGSDPPLDFVDHIAQQLGLERGAAQAMLCEWLDRFEPEHAALRRALLGGQ